MAPTSTVAVFGLRSPGKPSRPSPRGCPKNTPGQLHPTGVMPHLSWTKSIGDMPSDEVTTPRVDVPAQGGERPSPSKPVERLLELEPPGIRDFDDPALEWRRLFSELLGTFLLVIVGAGGAV